MERRAIRILIVLLVLIFALVAFGWCGFVLFEGVPTWEALSATINIISSVGLGSPPAESAAGWVVVAMLQIGSIGIVAVAVAALSQVVIAGTLRHYMGRNRMDERINKLNNHSIIAGYSLTGTALAKDLIEEGHPFVVIEHDADTINKLDEIGLLYIEGDATNEEVLIKAGIERARALYAVLSGDSDNLMVVLSARGLNENLTIVSRSTREEYIARFMRAGADTTISPQEWASRRMIQAVLRPHLLGLLSLLLDPAVSDTYLDEVKVPKDSSISGKTLAESGIRQASAIVILGIVREKDGECVSSPGPDTIVNAGDVLIGYGQRGNFASLIEFLGN